MGLVAPLAAKMATHKFIAESPYVGMEERSHHKSDFKYQKFLDSHNTASNTQVKRVALFGAGRAGSIHLANIVANPLIELAYVVESDSSSWEACRAKWNLGASMTTFLHPDNVAEVYADGTVDACVICTPTYTHEG